MEGGREGRMEGGRVGWMDEMMPVSGTHDVHALILGRAITGLQAFT